MASTLPSVSCLTLFVCILGVDIHTRRMCVTDRPVVQAASGSGNSAARVDVQDTTLLADTSPASLGGPERGIEFQVRSAVRTSNPDLEIIGWEIQDLQLDIELVRRGSDSKDVSLGEH